MNIMVTHSLVRPIRIEICITEINFKNYLALYLNVFTFVFCSITSDKTFLIDWCTYIVTKQTQQKTFDENKIKVTDKTTLRTGSFLGLTEIYRPARTLRGNLSNKTQYIIICMNIFSI